MPSYHHAIVPSCHRAIVRVKAKGRHASRSRPTCTTTHGPDPRPAPSEVRSPRLPACRLPVLVYLALGTSPLVARLFHMLDVGCWMLDVDVMWISPAAQTSETRDQRHPSGTRQAGRQAARQGLSLSLSLSLSHAEDSSLPACLRVCVWCLEPAATQYCIVVTHYSDFEP
jgi:hypothetical protein